MLSHGSAWFLSSKRVSGTHGEPQAQLKQREMQVKDKVNKQERKIKKKRKRAKKLLVVKMPNKPQRMLD
jgi:hypothetical protein